MAEQINYYEVLGVSRNASQSEVKNAYRKLAKERHPDRPGGSEAEFSRLQEANAVLSDPNRRRQHDEALDLAHAADQLAGVIDVDWDRLEDELSHKRREREPRSSSGGDPGGPSLGERLRNRFRREDDVNGSGGRAATRRERYREPARQARWYEPHTFDPEPITWKTGALSFLGAFLAFIVVGQIGLWAITPVQVDLGVMSWTRALAPFGLWLLYALVGFSGAYFAYRASGWAGIALVFVAALVVQSAGPGRAMAVFATVGIALLIAAIYLGQRRVNTGWRDRRR